MSSSTSTDDAALAALYQLVRTDSTLAAAVTTLLLYDVLVCMDKEIQYVYRRTTTSHKISRLLYVYNRYMSIVWNMVNLVTPSSVSDTSCTALSWFGNCLPTLGMMGPAALTTLRVYALSGRHKTVTGAALALSTIPFLINVSTLYQDAAANLAAPENCTTYINASTTSYIATVIASRSSMILAEMLAMACAWRRTRIANQPSTDVFRRPSLQQILWENGNVYFCTLVALNIMDMLFAVLPIVTPLSGAGGSYIVIFIEPMSAILNCRFLLALYETNAMLERGGSSLSSLSFGLGYRPGSPALPEFVTSFAGPVHSTYNEDLDMLGLDPAPEPQQVEDVEEVSRGGGGGEVGESSQA